MRYLDDDPRPRDGLTAEIDQGPSGARIGAFFDLDRTLVEGYSAWAFIREQLASGAMSARDFLETFAASASWSLGRSSFSSFMARTTAAARGLPELDFEILGERVFADHLAQRIHREARRLVDAHRAAGHHVAIVSSATPYQVAPVARELSIPTFRSSRLAVRDGRFTGEVERPSCYGKGKAIAGRELASRHALDLSQSYFYTDSHEDLPLLEIVGRPRPVNPTRALSEIARERGWPIRHFETTRPPFETRWPRLGRLLTPPRSRATLESLRGT